MDREARTVSWNAPVLTVDGLQYDLSLLEDGATAQHEVLLSVSRDKNDYSVTLALPHGANAPESTRFPSPSIVSQDGSVEVPVYDGEV